MNEATVYSKDDYDYTGLDTRSDLKECPLCRKLFYPEGRNASRQRYCKRSHFVDCVICGTPVLQKDVSSSIKVTCSKKCADQLKIKSAQKTMLEKYGYSNPSQIPEFKEKISVSLKAKAPETTAKVVATMQERYGGMGTGSPILRKKIEATMQERYGVSNPSKNDEIRAKISEICRSDEYQRKYTATALANWGVDRPSKTQAVKDKMQQTNIDKYGVGCALQTDHAKEQFKLSCMNKYGVPNVLQSEYGMQRAREGYIAHMHDHNNKISQINQEIASYFKSEFGIETAFEKMIGALSYDLEVVGTNILLEVDPSYTHSDLPNHWTSKGLDPDYHVKKSEVASENGFRCIHIFDWDDLSKIGSMLRPRSPIYARDCNIKNLSEKVASQFIDLNHLQGKTKGALACYGLYYDEELVQVMTFGKPRYNKNYEWELLRLCTVPQYVVVGGASRLFSHFIKEQCPQSVISYCDRSKFNGQVYIQIGMELHHVSPPAKIWSKGTKYITHNLLLQRGYDQIFNTNFGKGASNELLMVENGWRSVYDCGQLVFEWRRE